VPFLGVFGKILKLKNITLKIGANPNSNMNINDYFFVS